MRRHRTACARAGALALAGLLVPVSLHAQSCGSLGKWTSVVWDQYGEESREAELRELRLLPRAMLILLEECRFVLAPGPLDLLRGPGHPGTVSNEAGAVPSLSGDRRKRVEGL